MFKGRENSKTAKNKNKKISEPSEHLNAKYEALILKNEKKNCQILQI